METKPEFRFTCIECGTKFNAPDYEGRDGHTHVVEPKTYYAAAGELLTYVTAERLVTLADGTTQSVPPRKVQFLRGSFTTSDPLEQFGLDRNKVMITPEEWQRRFISTEDQLRMKEQRLQANNNRLEEENNKLLEQIKAQKLAAGKPVKEGAVA